MRQAIKYCLSIFVFSFFIWSCAFAPGSYPYAEKCRIELNEKSLIALVTEFKRENPIYNVPNTVQLIDGKKDSTDYWYHIYFYFPAENEILHTWIREKDKGSADFAFVGVNNGLTLGNWRLINKDFSRAENKKSLSLFESRVLQPIKEKIKDTK